MRVIAGSRKKTVLETIEGMNTRPTTDRIKETLFNMICDDIYDCRFLDLFAGSGQIGIEALSRGASYACFVEHNKGALQCIKNNLVKTRFLDVSEVIGKDVMQALFELAGKSTFHVIFMDPPYQLGIEKQVLEAISKYQLLDDEGYIIVEADKHRELTFVEDTGFHIVKVKEYKTNKHIFIEKDMEDEESNLSR